MKQEQLLKLVKENGEEAIDYYFNNQQELKNVDYNTKLSDRMIIRCLTIDGLDHEVMRFSIDTQFEMEPSC